MEIAGKAKTTNTTWLASFFDVTYKYPSKPDQRQANGLLHMVQGLLIGSVVAFGIFFIDPPQNGLFSIGNVVFNVAMVAYVLIILTNVMTMVGVSSLVNRGELKLASNLFVASLVVIGYLAGAHNDPTDISAVGLTIPLVAAGALFNRRDLKIVTLIVLAIFTLNLVVHHTVGVSFHRGHLNAEETAFFMFIIMFINYSILNVFAGGRAQLLEERQQLIDELEQANNELESRVAARTRDLTVGADVALQITTVLDFEQLLTDVVDRMVKSFELAHVSIFLYDEDERVLRLKQGHGEPGDAMVSMGKHFNIEDSGLVPQAARSQKAALSNNVFNAPDYVPNPLLPNTQSELAIPMVFQGRLVGVLDLQSEKLDRFTDADKRIMRILADQFATAVQNAQLFEQTKLAKEDAEKANQVKSAFLASMSHELRTPLNAIINFTKFVAKGSMGPVNDEQRETLNEVIDSGKHLLNLINDVLDMSKIGAGSLKLFVEPEVDLNGMLKSLVATGNTLINERPIEIRTEISAELPSIMGDRQRIYQVMLNMMSNACKFTEEGHITIRAYSEDEHFFFGIEDSGPGIAPEDQSMVFESFKQTETGLRQGGGTGLGMPISKSLVEAHDGRMWLESTPGEGATFYVALPLSSRVLEPTLSSR